EADFYKKLDDEVIATKKPVEIEEIKETTIGKISLLSVKFPLLDNENDVFGVSGISTDITERANYQQKLIEAKQIAEEARKDAEEAKSMEEQFLANMSHEIRTPMNGIQGMTNLLLETELNGQQKEFATIIKRSVNNLLVIINDILDFSKIKAGKLTIEQADFSLQEVLDNIKAMFDHRVKKKELQFIFEADKTIPEVLVGDPFRLNQIIVNLVGNAIKFTEKGFVKIKISVLEKVGKQILLRFDVQDSGIGIASNEIGNIFESFTQANTSTTRLYGGTGLGLAISKKLAEMQGGKIWVESEKGVGSTFSFQIPYTINDSTTKPVPHLIGEVDYTQFFKDKQCLVVEDNEVNQKLIHYVLTKVGIKVAVANHGKEA
ncbi:MAG: ATP-binding protein, partial [Chitinophagaceae bacterium]